MLVSDKIYYHEMHAFHCIKLRMVAGLRQDLLKILVDSLASE